MLARWYSEPLAVVDIPLADGAADAEPGGPGALAVRRGAGHSPLLGCGRSPARTPRRRRWSLSGLAQHRWRLRHPGQRPSAGPAGAARQRASAAVAAVVPDRPGGDAAERAAGQRDHLHQGPRRAAGQLPGRGAPPGLPGLRGHRGGQRPRRRRGGRPGGPTATRPGPAAFRCGTSSSTGPGCPGRATPGCTPPPGGSSPTWTTMSTRTGTGWPSSRAGSPSATGSSGSAGWCCRPCSTRPRSACTSSSAGTARAAA